ncbi:hypothetical protein [Micromonospora halophytica]|uniref:Uncharacterized protein n=1 Tax=Micromonospora halophytica TaxID=47864 RepID=A0A1C5HHB7_9ACTN|nr:hypothetical protein [Micromonospora halophytica]SCG45406.1 hypothetical protein GA0070560_104191 [Micromonospora halophytica]
MKRIRRPGVRRLGLAAAGAVAVTALVASVGVGNADTGVRYDARPEGLAFGKEAYHFDTVEQMTATSHLVVLGTVLSAAPGRLGSVDEDPAAVGGDIRLRTVTLDVVDVLHNPKNLLVPPRITLEEEGWDEEGRGYVANNVAWSEVGDTGYFFLRRAAGVTDPHTFQLASSDGRALVVDGALKPSNPENDLATSISTMAPSFLNNSVVVASGQVAAGTLTPSVPTGDLPLPPEESGE